MNIHTTRSALAFSLLNGLALISLLFLSLAFISCKSSLGGQATTTLTFKNAHANAITIYWGSYVVNGSKSSMGSLAESSLASASTTVPADTSLNIWYTENGATAYLASTTSSSTPYVFSFGEGTQNTLLFNADHTWILNPVAAQTKLPPVVYQPQILNTSSDPVAANFAVIKGNLWYSPSDKMLFAMVKLQNNNGVAEDIGSLYWQITLKDASGTTLYTSSQKLSGTSTTPMVYTTYSSVYPFDADVGAYFYLGPLSDAGGITLGNADTQFTPNQVARVEIAYAGSSPLTPSYISSTWFFLSADRRLTMTATSKTSSSFLATIVNGSTGTSYSTSLTRLMAVDASGNYIGITNLKDSTGTQITVIPFGQTIQATAFSGYPGLSQIAGLEFVPYYTYSSGIYKALLASRALKTAASSEPREGQADASQDQALLLEDHAAYLNQIGLR